MKAIRLFPLAGLLLLLLLAQSVTEAQPPAAANLTVMVAVDNDVEVFLNGVDISGGLNTHDYCPALDDFQFTAPDSLLRAHNNLLAVRAKDRYVESFLDLRVVFGPSGTEVIPYQATGYRFKVYSWDTVPGDYGSETFDDSAFSVGDAAFGSNPSGACPVLDPTIATNWTALTELVVRKNFDLPAIVGGTAELPDISDSSTPNYTLLAGAIAAAALALAAGGWYARRRWLR